MAQRSSFTLTEKDLAILKNFREELGVSSSQAVATAVRVADVIRQQQKLDKDLVLRDKNTGDTEKVLILGLHD